MSACHLLVCSTCSSRDLITTLSQKSLKISRSWRSGYLGDAHAAEKVSDLRETRAVDLLRRK